MKKYHCAQCGCCYDLTAAESEIDSEEEFPCEPNEVFYDHESFRSNASEISLEDLPESWTCPQCGCSKKDFVSMECAES